MVLLGGRLIISRHGLWIRDRSARRLKQIVERERAKGRSDDEIADALYFLGSAWVDYRKVW